MPRLASKTFRSAFFYPKPTDEEKSTPSAHDKMTSILKEVYVNDRKIYLQ